MTLVATDLMSPDLDWNFALVTVWSITESNMAIVCGNTPESYPFGVMLIDWSTACLPSLRPILSLIMTGSPNQSHSLKKQSEKRYATGLFEKRSQNFASYSAQGDTVNEHNSQRGFVPLSEAPAVSNAFAANAEPTPFRNENGFGHDIEMQGLNNIHVRNEMSSDYFVGE